MSTLRLIQRVPVTVYEDRVLLETDDWLEVESEASRLNFDSAGVPRIDGVHPSHDFLNGRCVNDGCRSFNNGSYGSHAPCGFDFGGRSLRDHIHRWRKAHKSPAS